jgi:hypothetical protein
MRGPRAGIRMGGIRPGLGGRTRARGAARELPSASDSGAMRARFLEGMCGGGLGEGDRDEVFLIPTEAWRGGHARG